MTTHAALLAAYDALRPWVPANPPPGLSYEQRGSVVRVVGQHRGFIDTARNVGAQGEALDALITEQRDFFAQRGEAVEWKTRGHDQPPDLPARLLAAGVVPENREAVVIGVAEQMAVDPVLPDGVMLRQVHEPGDFAMSLTSTLVAPRSCRRREVEGRVPLQFWDGRIVRNEPCRAAASPPVTAC